MYIIEKEEGISLDLDKRMAQRPTVRFVIKCTLDGRIVWHGAKRWASTSPRVIAGMRLQASNVMKRYENYLRSHGKRWEIVEEEKRILAKNKKRLADLDALIPKLEAERDKLRLEISKQAEANSLINEA